MDMPVSGEGRACEGNRLNPQSPESTPSLEQELFDDADGGVLAAADVDRDARGGTPSQLASKLDECLAKLSDVAQALRGHQANDEATGKLHQSYQALLEQFHDREVLRPVFLQLIAIADRCREKIARLEAFLGKHGAAKNSAKCDLVRYLVSARQADLVEIENILANFGVSPFENPDETFDRSMQTCAVSTVAERQGLAGKIARRLRPGYRRNAQVIRPECIAVYVSSPKASD